MTRPKAAMKGISASEIVRQLSELSFPMTAAVIEKAATLGLIQPIGGKLQNGFAPDAVETLKTVAAFRVAGVSLEWTTVLLRHRGVLAKRMLGHASVDAQQRQLRERMEAAGITIDDLIAVRSGRKALDALTIEQREVSREFDAFFNTATGGKELGEYISMLYDASLMLMKRNAQITLAAALVQNMLDVAKKQFAPSTEEKK